MGPIVGLFTVAPTIFSSLNTGMSSSKPARALILRAALYYFELAETLHVSKTAYQIPEGNIVT